MSELLESILQRAERASGPLAEEVARNLLIQTWAELNPTPSPWRVPKMPDGSDWPGDGIGPYTPEAIAWQARDKQFRKLAESGATLDAALALTDPEWWPKIARMKDGSWKVFLGTSTPTMGQVGKGSSAALALLAAVLREHIPAKEVVE